MKKDLIGQKFGRLTVVAESPSRVTGVGYRTTMWECRCDCGNTVVVRAKCLLGGVTKSCGCLQREQLTNGIEKDLALLKFLKNKNTHILTPLEP